MKYSNSSKYRIISVAIAIVFLLVSIAIDTENVQAAAKLKIDSTSKAVYVGKTVKLKANTNVKWKLQKNKGIAKLISVKKKTVKVKGLKTGTVYIVAKSGNQTRKTKIVVVKRGAPLKINLSTSKETIGIGESCVVSVKSITPAGTSNKVTFSSSDTSVALAYGSGLVIGNKVGKVIITAKSKADSNVTASVELNVVDAKAGILTASIDMSDTSRYPAGKAVKAWFPVPVSDYNQSISAVKYEAPKATRAEIKNSSSGDEAFYVEWGPDVIPADRKATLSFHVYRREVVHSKDLRSREKGKVDTEKYAEYLRQTQYSGSLTDGIVKETADKIVADAKAKTVYDKAHAIYLWICENITRDKSLANRELGDVVAVLSGQRDAGSCIDINSIFVALCNAEGIPARDSFGYKINSDQTKLGPNCRAEFYLPGHGWVEVDPAMPLGVIMYKEDQYRGENAPKADEWEVIKETYWTTGSASWICQNHGRDITFDPPQSAAPDYMVNPDRTLNHFMFPYGEYDGKYIKSWGDYNKTFSYEYSFEEEDPLDCGC